MLYRNTEGLPRETVMHVAHELRQRGLTQGVIASALGCSQSTVSMWLRDVQMHQYQVDRAQVESATRLFLERQI